MTNGDTMSDDARVIRAPAIDGWAIVELMGHRIRSGRVSEVEIAGGKMLRVEIPTSDEQTVTELYSVSAIYALRPCSESVAKATAGHHDPRPFNPADWRKETRAIASQSEDAADDPRF